MRGSLPEPKHYERFCDSSRIRTRSRRTLLPAHCTQPLASIRFIFPIRKFDLRGIDEVPKKSRERHTIGIAAAAVQRATHDPSIVSLLEPGGHGVHMLLFTRSVAVEYVPSSHGSAADAPSLQNDPCEHALHAVAPARSWKVPPAHFKHVAAPC